MSEERTRILKMVAEGKISASEADELLDAIGRPGKAPDAEPMHSRNIKYMYVKVLGTGGDNVDVRVPLGLIRAGMRLTALIPPQAMDHINAQMRSHGMKFDLNNLKPDDIEELIKNLADLEVNVKSKNGDMVKVWCGE